MNPKPASEAVRRAMQSQKRTDTVPEMALRRLLHARGLRYRVGAGVPGLPRRTIDIAFMTQKVAVFVDGCFWHGCPEHCVVPKNNREWWLEKLEANRTRDLETTERLISSGWRVVRLWEHEDPEHMAGAVQRLVRGLED